MPPGEKRTSQEGESGSCTVSSAEARSPRRAFVLANRRLQELEPVTEVRIRYTVTRASLLAGLLAGTDFVKTGLYQAILFSAIMSWAFKDAVSSWASAPVVLEWLCGSVLSGIAFAIFTTCAIAFLVFPIRTRGLVGQNPLLFGDMELEANDTQVIITGPRSTAKYAWSDLHGFKEARRVFVIALGKSAFFAIPKAGMPPATQDSFRALLEAHLRRIRSGGLG
jgi:hypothetical protein